MNDNAIATVGGTSRVALGGLAQRLVQDGLVDEASMQDAIAKAARSADRHLQILEAGGQAPIATAVEQTFE